MSVSLAIATLIRAIFDDIFIKQCWQDMDVLSEPNKEGKVKMIRKVASEGNLKHWSDC